MDKVVYSQKAPEKSNVKSRTIAFIVTAAIFIVLLVVVNLLPYSGILTIVVFGVGAYAFYKLLNNTVFDITYTLYEDKLVFMRRYGNLTWENEVFPFEEAKFYPNKIEHRGKVYEFCPDDELKVLLGI